ncbi:response regulator [Streptomyces sp. NPDC002012]|uniref:response regulator n=1 Tax=unclassified Streptomyces TaxID=2593676 RepID=UPI003330A25C
MKRVLVVDDEPRMLGVLSTALRARDYSVSTAPDAGTALRLAAGRPVDELAARLRAVPGQAPGPRKPPAPSTSARTPWT